MVICGVEIEYLNMISKSIRNASFDNIGNMQCIFPYSIFLKKKDQRKRYIEHAPLKMAM